MNKSLGNSFGSPLVSVVIPNYNCGDYIADCLESVIAQTYSNFEIIVIDDGSTDNSSQVLSNYVSRVQVIYTQNQGAATARNLGIASAKGEFIAFLDSDDIWAADKLERQMSLMLTGGNDLVYCSSREFYSDGTVGAIKIAQYRGSCYAYFKQFPTRAIIVQGCSGAVIRSSLLDISGEFDSAFLGAAEDWDFFRRYCRYAKVEYISDVLVHYRKHSSSIMSRPVFDWYSGNMKAVANMLADDVEIGLIEKRFIWIRFQYIALKEFLKIRHFRLALIAGRSIFESTNRNFK